MKSGENEYLFNLAVDETEEVDLRAEQKNIFEQLGAEYEKWVLDLEPSEHLADKYRQMAQERQNIPLLCHSPKTKIEGNF